MVSCKGLMLWISSHVMFSVVYLGLYGCSCYVMLIFDDNMFDIVLCLVYSLSYFFGFFSYAMDLFMVQYYGYTYGYKFCYAYLL